jgi:antibiotic biosynthesis monooxygenase (ABM) superfamily enzyme
MDQWFDNGIVMVKKCCFKVHLIILANKYFITIGQNRYLTGSLFKKVTKKLDTGEIQIFFPDGIICG